MDKKILDKIKQVRVSAGISIQRLALSSGISAVSICNIEGGHMPSMKNLAKILNALNLCIIEKNFLDTIRVKRKSLNITLEKMARISGVSISVIHQIEQGVMPSTKTCCIIAKELDIPLVELIKWPDNKI